MRYELRLRSICFATDDARNVKWNDAGSNFGNEFGNSLRYGDGHRSRLRSKYRSRENPRRRRLHD